MKVINVTPGLLPIPPNGWGAVEKVIWDYHLELKNNGIKSEIKYLNEIKYDDSMVVHVHVANLANECFERGIPYIFTIHDHHAYLYGKDSHCFKENLKAIENSVLSTSPCKFLVDYFDSKKLRYFSHAVNTKTFINKNYNRDFNLLCVANNGYAGRPDVDRKGFKIAIQAAMELNMPITIAGPKNNENFFKTLPKEINNYSGLKKLFDLNEEQLIEIYNNHSIFLHFSELEAGHPNLTLLEAMSCGLPIVGTFEEKAYEGMIVTERNVESAIDGIKYLVSNYSDIKQKALNNAKKNCYSNRVNDLVNLYSEYREKIFANRLIDSYKNTKKTVKSNRIITSFCDGAKIEILGNDPKKYFVEFIDKSSNSVLYCSEINNNMWSKSSKTFFIDWKLNVYEKDNFQKKLIYTEDLNLKNKKVCINIDTKSLGDLSAYIGQCDAFQKKHECILDCFIHSSEFLDLIKLNYKNINFILGIKDKSEYYASYDIGYYYDNWENKSPVDPKSIKLTYTAGCILGLPDEEIKPKFSFKIKSSHKKKYVCIATQSTSQCKYWNNPSGWKNLIKFLNEKGYEVWCIDKNKHFGNKIMNSIPVGAVDKTGNLPLAERLNQINNCEFFIGLGSGLSWLAWGLNKPVVLISGFSKPIAEFNTPYRIINENVCNGCWNNPSHKFDKGDWMWCPENKDFECTKSITAEMVIEKINNLL